MDNKQITMYSTSWCGDCRRAKVWFEENNITYKDIDIEKDQAALELVQKLNNGLNSVPTIVFPDQSILVEPSNQELEEKVRTVVLVKSSK